MFFVTYKNTLKTLFRSAIIWLCIVLVLFLVFERAVKANIGYAVVENDKIVDYVLDTDPEFELVYKNYVMMTMNAMCHWVMSYALPLFCVISTMVVLFGDYRNGLFEIEKSSGIKPSKYFFGRLIALLSINIIMCLVCSFSSIAYYYFSRGGVNDLSTISFLQTLSLNVFRTFLGAMLPAILFFIGITYVSASLLKSGFIGTVVGIGYVLFEYGTKTFLRFRMTDNYHDYFTPKPNKLYYFWGFYDIPELTTAIPDPFKTNDVVISTSIIVLFSVMFFMISFICLKRREI